jgi:signal transduction histidine kinase
VIRPAPLPPRAMWLRLVWSGLGPGALVCAGIVILGAFAVGPALGPWDDLVAVTGALFALLTAAVVLAATVVVHRTRPLYRALVRARDVDEPNAPPPSEAALRDAFDAPRWMGWATGILLVGALVAHGSGLLLLPGALAGRRLVYDLLAGGMLALGSLPVALLWQRTMWRWLEAVPPSEVPLAMHNTVVTRMAAAGGLPLLGVLLVGIAVLAGHVGATPGWGMGPWAGVGASLATLGLVALVLARGAGRALAQDLRGLCARIVRVREGAGDAGPTGGAVCRTGAIAGIAREVGGLADRHAQSVAEEAAARRAIEEVQQIKGRFMAYVSHDLRSPLNSIKGFAEILARGTDGPLEPAQRESVDMIRQSGDELLRLINDILDSAKLEAGRLELRTRWIPSVEILTEAVRQVRGLLVGREIQIVSELEPGLPPVHADRERVVQAVVGILAHVVRGMRQGIIRLRARVVPGPDGRPRDLRVEVIDEGASLRREDRERLFEAFRAVREASGRRIGGLGLGLSLARGLITAHGGDVWYEGRGPGAGGTTFCVSLPLTMGDGP